MRKVFFMLLIVLTGVIIFVTFNNSVDSQKGTNDSEVKKIRTPKQVNQIDVNDAFIDNPKKWSACWEVNDNIRDKEPGYVDEDYENYAIAHVYEGHDYGITQTGNKVVVTLTCEYTVSYQVSAFGFQKIDSEYPGGVFELTAHYNDKNDYLGLTFDE